MGRDSGEFSKGTRHMRSASGLHVVITIKSLGLLMYYGCEMTQSKHRNCIAPKYCLVFTLHGACDGARGMVRAARSVLKAQLMPIYPQARGGIQGRPLLNYQCFKPSALCFGCVSVLLLEVNDVVLR